MRYKLQLISYLLLFHISENITPIGDGNLLDTCIDKLSLWLRISENITPIGDGN